MEYRKFGDTYIVRMDRDEEILAQLKRRNRSNWPPSPL